MELTEFEKALIEDYRRNEPWEERFNRRYYIVDIQTDGKLIGIPNNENGRMMLTEEMTEEEKDRTVEMINQNMRLAEDLARNSLVNPNGSLVSIRLTAIDH